MTAVRNDWLCHPVASWLDYDFLPEEGRAIRSLTVILRTVGCSWRHCTMCGYWQEGAAVTQANILTQLAEALRKSPTEEFMLKIFTSGSFFDEREISRETLAAIASMLKGRPALKKLIVETRPKYLTTEKLTELQVVEHLELAIGLETANDFIRSRYIKKGFSFDEYRAAAHMARACGATVKTYLLLKPPFLSEKEAINDVIASAELAAPYSSAISLNLCTIQKDTPLEELWRRGYYRPPWLWSAVTAIRAIKSRGIMVLSDPVGAGAARGPHNCGACDAAISHAIRTFNVTQDPGVLERLEALSCKCSAVWAAVLRYDPVLFHASPISGWKGYQGKR
jgi:radical SAM enzyme (TIGR01210 family)